MRADKYLIGTPATKAKKTVSSTEFIRDYFPEMEHEVIRFITHASNLKLNDFLKSFTVDKLDKFINNEFTETVAKSIRKKFPLLKQLKVPLYEYTDHISKLAIPIDLNNVPDIISMSNYLIVDISQNQLYEHLISPLLNTISISSPRNVKGNKFVLQYYKHIKYTRRIEMKISDFYRMYVEEQMAESDDPRVMASHLVVMARKLEEYVNGPVRESDDVCIQMADLIYNCTLMIKDHRQCFNCIVDSDLMENEKFNKSISDSMDILASISRSLDEDLDPDLFWSVDRSIENLEVVLEEDEWI